MSCKTCLAPLCTSCSSMKMVSSGIGVAVAGKVGLLVPFDVQDEDDKEEQVLFVVVESTR